MQQRQERGGLWLRFHVVRALATTNNNMGATMAEWKSTRIILRHKVRFSWSQHGQCHRSSGVHRGDQRRWRHRRDLGRESVTGHDHDGFRAQNQNMHCIPDISHRTPNQQSFSVTTQLARVKSKRYLTDDMPEVGARITNRVGNANLCSRSRLPRARACQIIDKSSQVVSQSH